MNSLDLSGLKVVALCDIEGAAKSGVKEILCQEGAILTPSAREFVQQQGIALRSAAKGATAAASSGGTGGSAIERLFNSAEAQAIKEEICAVGRKLWMRQYVDGNGGNISFRLGPNEILCTPTLVSKGDLKPTDIGMVDLEGNQLAGGQPRTSEILLHLEIYKAVAEAKAVVHCHPAHATAYAITGKIPPTCVIPEADVFVGKVAISPYETPGTTKFAQTVIPFVKQHNTVLLSNHGIVCWADTVTHAEWYAEVVDTYCWTLMLAQQLGGLSHIPNDKAGDLLEIKQRLGLPDARIGAAQVCALPDQPGGITVTPGSGSTCCAPSASGNVTLTAAEKEHLVQAVAAAVEAAIRNQK